MGYVTSRCNLAVFSIELAKDTLILNPHGFTLITLVTINMFNLSGDVKHLGSESPKGQWKQILGHMSRIDPS